MLEETIGSLWMAQTKNAKKDNLYKNLSLSFFEQPSSNFHRKSIIKL